MGISFFLFNGWFVCVDEARVHQVLSLAAEGSDYHYTDFTTESLELLAL